MRLRRRFWVNQDLANCVQPTGPQLLFDNTLNLQSQFGSFTPNQSAFI